MLLREQKLITKTNPFRVPVPTNVKQIHLRLSSEALLEHSKHGGLLFVPDRKTRHSPAKKFSSSTHNFIKQDVNYNDSLRRKPFRSERCANLNSEFSRITLVCRESTMKTAFQRACEADAFKHTNLTWWKLIQVKTINPCFRGRNCQFFCFESRQGGVGRTCCQHWKPQTKASSLVIVDCDSNPSARCCSYLTS